MFVKITKTSVLLTPLWINDKNIACVRDAKQKFNSKIITAKALTKKSLCRFLLQKKGVDVYGQIHNKACAARYINLIRIDRDHIRNDQGYAGKSVTIKNISGDVLKRWKQLMD